MNSFLKMAGKRKRDDKKKKTTKKSRKTTSKRTQKRTRRKSTKLGKKYAHYNRLNRPYGRAPKDMQPKVTKVRSKAPTAVRPDAIVLRDVAKSYKLTPAKQDVNKKKKWNKFKSVTKKVAKGTKDVIEETGKLLDKAGYLAEDVAPAMTAFTAANPEMAPWLAPLTGAVDSFAGMHYEYRNMIDESYKGAQKGDYNRSGVKLLTDSGKYQKLMADTSDEDYVMSLYGAPEQIDTIPPDEEPSRIMHGPSNALLSTHAAFDDL